MSVLLGLRLPRQNCVSLTEKVIVKESELRQPRQNCVNLREKVNVKESDQRHLRWNCVSLTEKVIFKELELHQPHREGSCEGVGTTSRLQRR